MYIKHGWVKIQIKMPLYELPNSTKGMDAILVDVSTAVPSFTPMFLFFIFAVVLLGGSTLQRRRTGYSDFPFWSVLASIGTLLIALPLTLIVGAINMQTLGVVIVATLLSGLWFFMSKGRYES